jgi:hypothetical protein
MNMRAAALGLCALGSIATNAPADVITDWSDVYVDAIRATGGPPCPISRSSAMLTLAMYDAVNGIALGSGGFGYSPYQQNLPTPANGASRKAAASAAAHHVMTMMYGTGAATPNAELQAMFDAQLATSLRGISAGAAQAGINYGTAVASNLLALRAGDGYDADSSYTPGGNAGDWMVTPDGPNVAPFSPQWGNVTPWGLQSGDQFRPTRFQDMFGMSMDTMMHSAEYAEQINGGPGVFGVKDYGARDSFLRSEDQTESAWFWANDRDGTCKPPGQLLQITRIVSEQQGLSLLENARLYALVGLAMGDAAIASWDSKYNTPIDLWRPIDAIRETLDDGNALTSPVADWLPLNDFTPPFPAYVSGHATFGAAHAAVMAAFFGTDNISFTVGSDEFIINPDLGYPSNLSRTFSSFSEAAWENAMSRVFLGVHYQWDAEDGNALGYDVGNYLFANYFQPIPAPPAMLALLLGFPMLGRRRARPVC